jgi:two-component system chemotaxis sensor kinase CheA
MPGWSLVPFVGRGNLPGLLERAGKNGTGKGGLSTMMDKQREAFREEAGELLSDLEEALLELEENPENTEVIARVFRAMHTIKGSGAMFGFDQIAAFTHEVETVFDQVRNGHLAVTKELVDLSLAARDHIKILLESGEELDPEVRSAGEQLASAFRHLLPGAEADSGAGEPESPTESAADFPPAAEITYRLRLHLPQDIVLRGTRPDALLDELSELGSPRIVAQTEPIPHLADLTPEHCHTFWDIILTTDRGLDAIRDVFIFIEDEIELKIDVIDDGGNLDSENDYKRLGEILVERGDLSPDDLTEVLSSQKPIGELLVASKGLPRGKVAAALEEQAVVRASGCRRINSIFWSIWSANWLPSKPVSARPQPFATTRICSPLPKRSNG